MENNISAFQAEDRRRTDRRTSPDGSLSTESEVWVLKTKLDMLTDNIAEIRDTLRRIVEIISVISVIEVNAKQLSKESELLSAAVQDIQDQADKIERALTSSIQATEEKLNSKVKTVQTDLDQVKSKWDEKYNMARGMWLVVSAIFSIVGAASVMYVKSYNSKVDELYTWMDHHKLETTLRAEKDKSGSGSNRGNQ